MANKPVSRSVIFYKRMIAAVLAVIILCLAGFGVMQSMKLKAERAELDAARAELGRRDAEEAERLAREEAERIRNTPPAEKAKPAGERGADEMIAEASVVAHALGAVDGIEGLNCLEGFRASYEAGTRVFEADLRMTTDGHVVLRHDWMGGLQEGISPTSIPTLEEFLSKPILDKYTPMSFRDLLRLMEEYPDICVITDTKFTDEESVTLQFRAMTDDARALGLSYLFDRMIIQVYSPEHFAVVEGVRHFPHYIYTLYQDYFGRDEDSFRNKCIFCQENGILGLTLNAELWDSDYAPISNWRKILVFVHTVDDAEYAKRLIKSGVHAVYSDTLREGELGD